MAASELTLWQGGDGENFSRHEEGRVVFGNASFIEVTWEGSISVEKDYRSFDINRPFGLLKKGQYEDYYQYDTNRYEKHSIVIYAPEELIDSDEFRAAKEKELAELCNLLI